MIRIEVHRIVKFFSCYSSVGASQRYHLLPSHHLQVCLPLLYLFSTGCWSLLLQVCNAGFSLCEIQPSFLVWRRGPRGHTTPPLSRLHGFIMTMRECAYHTVCAPFLALSRRQLLEDPKLAPEMVKLAVADALGFDATTQTGGPDGSVVLELDRFVLASGRDSSAYGRGARQPGS